MPKFAVIAIDGPAGSGKSTVSKRAAQELGFHHLDSGATYRAFACHYLEGLPHVPSELNLNRIQERCQSFRLQTDGKGRWWLSESEITQKIRTPEISSFSSRIAKEKIVRETLVAWQRSFADQKNVVAEGRDTATVVFPSADLKVYLTASLSIRAKRRWQELAAIQHSLSLKEVETEVAQRDQQDKTREHSPLAIAQDALCLDTSDLTIDQVVKRIVEIWYRKSNRL